MWRHSSVSALAQVKTCFECTKPIPEPTLTNHRWRFVSSGLLGSGFVFVSSDVSGVQLFSSFSVTIWVHYALSRTVECRCNAVQFIAILHVHMLIRRQQQNVNQISNSQKAHPSSPVSIMRILKELDRVITAPHSTCTWERCVFTSNLYRLCRHICQEH